MGGRASMITRSVQLKPHVLLIVMSFVPTALAKLPVPNATNLLLITTSEQLVDRKCFDAQMVFVAHHVMMLLYTPNAMKTIRCNVRIFLVQQVKRRAPIKLTVL